MTRFTTKTGSDSNHANHALQRTAAGRRGYNRRVSWPPSLSLGRSKKSIREFT